MKHFKVNAIIKAIILTVLTMMIGLGFTQSAQAADDSLQRIKDKGTLVMVTSPDYPPYEFLTNKHGKDVAVGMDIDVAKKIAKDLKVKLVIKKMSYDTLLVAIETGKADMAIGGINPTEKRRQSVDFSDIYYSGGQSFLLTKSNKNHFKKQGDLKGKTIGAQTGTLQYELAKKKIANSTVKGMEKNSDLVLALKTGKIDALGIEKPTAQAYVKNDKSLVMIDSDYDLSSDDIGAAAAFKKGSGSLVAAVNKSIAEIKAKNLTEQYIGNAGKLMDLNTVDTSMIHYWRYFVKGVNYTILISIISTFFGVLLGVILALMRFSKQKLFNGISIAYTEFVRGTPLMVQVLFVYFGIGTLVNIPALTSGIIAVSLNSAAYVAEIIRGGINSVDKGQTEASESLGLSRKDALRFVILPQAFKNIWPALGNEFISLIKESSIVSIIGVTDLIYQLNIVRADTYRGVMPIFIAMVLYFIMTFLLTRLLNYFEGKMKHAG